MIDLFEINKQIIKKKFWWLNQVSSNCFFFASQFVLYIYIYIKSNNTIFGKDGGCSSLVFCNWKKNWKSLIYVLYICTNIIIVFLAQKTPFLYKIYEK